VTVTEPIFVKIKLRRQLFVLNCCTEIRALSTNGLANHSNSWTERGTGGCELYIRRFYLLSEKRLIIYKYLKVILKNVELYLHILVLHFKALS
jgi:hypothetical protein